MVNGVSFAADAGELVLNPLAAPLVHVTPDLTLSWESQPEALYQVQTTEDLREPDWRPWAQTALVTGGRITVADPQPQTANPRFYRLVVTPRP